jgi:hypothetical protein
LDQLIRGWRSTILPALEKVLLRCMPGEFGRPQRTSIDAVACRIRATDRALQSSDVGQQILRWNKDVIHRDPPCNGSSAAEPAFDQFAYTKIFSHMRKMLVKGVYEFPFRAMI